MKSNPNSPVLAEELHHPSGHKIGVLTLNQAAALNAVDLNMVGLLEQQLDIWHKDPQIKAVILRGAGDKAFCAGGDIRQIYHSIKAEGAEQYQYADTFFAAEYRKNYRLSLYEKPLISWGNGFVMGGGAGLFLSCNHRVSTENIKFAWPEIRIGLFPDCSGSWYLSRLPQPVGWWMGLSASHFNALDCKQLKLSNYCLEHQQYAAVVSGLVDLPFAENNAINHSLVRDFLSHLEVPQAMPESELDKAKANLNEFFKVPELGAIEAAFRTYKGKNAWLNQGISNYFAGCPATAQLILRQVKRAARLSLKEVARWELDMAYQASRHPDFAEGVRAMVVDKDYQPQWQHPNTAAVPLQWLDQLSTSPWQEETHPLKNIEGW